MNDTKRAGSTQRLPLFTMLGATGLSMVGNIITFLAVPWFVLQTTGSAARTGLTGVVVVLGMVLGGFFGGPLVDRLGFRRASIVADLASGVTVTLIPLLYITVGLAFWQLLVLVLLGTCLDTPGMTARQSLIPNLAGRARMPVEHANSALQGIESSSDLLGPPLAGVLIAVLGPSNVLFLDAATFALSAAMIAGAVPRPVLMPVEKAPIGGYFANLLQGLRFIRGEQFILSIVVVAVITNFLDSPIFLVILPVYADANFGSAVVLGVMFAGFGAGSLVGTLLFGALGHRLPRRTTLIACWVAVGLPFWVLQAERQAHAEARRILAAALERIPAIEAPQEPSEDAETAEEAQEGRATGPLLQARRRAHGGPGSVGYSGADKARGDERMADFEYYKEDDAGFSSWLGKHPDDGFVLNCYNTGKLHTASCKSYQSAGPRMTYTRPKACSTSERELRMRQYEVVVRYENSRSDTFIAKDPPDTPDAILTNQSELVPFPYTAPSGQALVCYIRANKVASVIVREIEGPE